MFNISAEERLIFWRDFREQLQQYSIEEQHSRTLNLWKSAPLSNQFLSPDLIEEWPDPWELITNNYYDEIAVSLGIYYTLVLETGSLDYIIQCVEGTCGLTTFVLHLPSKTTLNYDWGEAVNTELIEKQEFRYSYSWEDFNIR